MHRKDRYPVVHIRQTRTVPRSRIGTVMQRLYAGLHSRNARKFGKHRRGTLVLHGFDGQQDKETGMWTVVMEFRQYKGNKIQAYSREHDKFVAVKMPIYPYNDFRKLFR